MPARFVPVARADDTRRWSDLVLLQRLLCADPKAFCRPQGFTSMFLGRRDPSFSPAMGKVRPLMNHGGALGPETPDGGSAGWHCCAALRGLAQEWDRLSPGEDVSGGAGSGQGVLPAAALRAAGQTWQPPSRRPCCTRGGTGAVGSAGGFLKSSQKMDHEVDVDPF